MKLSPEIRAYMSTLGKVGGKASGDRKRRSPEHYRKVAAAMTEGRRKAAEKRKLCKENNKQIEN